MIEDIATARRTAEYLLEIEAVKLSPADYFTWASGWHSPVYCDNRLTLSYPHIRTFLAGSMAKIIENRDIRPDVIAGVATGAIAIGMLVAQQMGLPFVYVRPEPKKHGRRNQIEGHLPEGSRVVVIEDLISTGGSSLCAVEALREAGADVLYMTAIMTYGFDIARENFERAGVKLTTLCEYGVLVEKAAESGYVRPEELELLARWRKDPAGWMREE